MTRVAVMFAAMVSSGMPLAACDRGEDTTKIEAGVVATTSSDPGSEASAEDDDPRNGASERDVTEREDLASPDALRPLQVDAGKGPDATAEAPMAGSGEIHIAQDGNAALAVGAFARAAARSESCAEQRFGECRVLYCAPSPDAGAAQLLAPGEVTIAGPSATCVLSEQTTSAPGSCTAPTGRFWDPAMSGMLVVIGKGGAFPAFRVEVETPAALAIGDPGNFELARDLPFQLRWRGGGGLVELSLATEQSCASAPPTQRVRAICSADAGRGALSVGVEVMAALAKQRCLKARVTHTTSQTTRVSDYTVAAAATLDVPVDFTFAPEVSGSCAGNHKPCASYASNEPSSCTRHGCTWQAGACVGAPHPCVLVPEAECSPTGADHGCNVP